VGVAPDGAAREQANQGLAMSETAEGPQHDPAVRKKRPRRRWWFRVVIALGVLVGVGVFLHWPVPVELEISPETTVLTGPLNADGTVNYLAALNEMASEGVTPENNAAVPLMKALGPDFLPGPEYCPPEVEEEFYSRLGMTPLPEVGEYFVLLEDWCAGQASPASAPDLEEQLKKIMESPWAAEDFPKIAAWLRANQGPLDRIAAATRRSQCYLPLVSVRRPPRAFSSLGAMFMLPNRRIGRALTARAMHHVRHDRVDEAWADILAMWRLGRHLQRAMTACEHMIGIAVESLAATTTARLAGASRLDRARLRRMLADMDALPAPRPLAEIIDRFERFLTLSWTVAWHRDPSGMREAHPQDGTVQRWHREREKGLDTNLLLRMANEWYDKMAAAAKMPPSPARRRAFDDIEGDLGERQGPSTWDRVKAFLYRLGGRPCRGVRTRLKGGALLAELQFSARRMVQLADRASVRGDLARVGLALAAHKADSGDWPESLDALSPEYLRAVPADRFAGRPLVYRRHDGGYLLYSVGPNLEDDGGDDEGSGADDMAVRVPPPAAEAVAGGAG
jgi:hypothetical protein